MCWLLVLTISKKLTSIWLTFATLFLTVVKTIGAKRRRQLSCERDDCGHTSVTVTPYNAWLITLDLPQGASRVIFTELLKQVGKVI